MPDHIVRDQDDGFVYIDDRPLTPTEAIDLLDALDALQGVTAWYLEPTSGCPTCGHGPRWHDHESGCVRTLSGMCPCERRYLPTSTGPDDFQGSDGPYFADAR